MPWLYLCIAGVFEVVWATMMKFSHGFSKPIPTVCTIIGMIISFYFLSAATKTLPLGTAYAIWTGIGAIGTVLVGIILFQEPLHVTRILFLLLILVGILGLKLTSS
ncbi:MAG TPA: multidrug efflux SMR transporter [Candidatus Anaerotignum merdipullorum]|nr:multidrug efflux SMR transporter [Candidatus Anaerotignum merdipullorum]